MPEIQNIPTTQYIGPRIIPHLWDPIAWSASEQYDALAVVQYNGVPYVSRYVPPMGTLPTNTEYWVRWADFNAQMAQLQQTVETFEDRITSTEQDLTAETNARTAADTALGNRITSAQQDITAETSARTAADTALGNRITSAQQDLAALDANVALKQSAVVADVNSTADIRSSIPFEDDYFNERPHSIVFVEDNTVRNALASSGFELLASGNIDAAWSITLANSYALHHEELYYGNTYVPIGFEGSISDYTRINPRQHRNVNNQMEIDCNTLTQLCGHGVLWENSNYVLDGQIRFGHKMFDERSMGVIPYWFYGSQKYRDPSNFTGARLITDNFAKFLYDHGRLEPVTPNDAFELGIGRIYFSGDRENRFMGINHCYMVTGQLAPTVGGTFTTESFQSSGYSVISRGIVDYNRQNTKAAFTPPWNASRFVNQYTLRGYMVQYNNRDIYSTQIEWNTDDRYYGARIIAICIDPDGNAHPITITATNHVTGEIKTVQVSVYTEYLAYLPAQWDITIKATTPTTANVNLQIVPSDNFISMPSRP